MTLPKKKERPYYYVIYDYSCPICWRGKQERERVYGEKPKDYNDTHKFIDHYDYCNAL